MKEITTNQTAMVNGAGAGAAEAACLVGFTALGTLGGFIIGGGAALGALIGGAAGFFGGFGFGAGPGASAGLTGGGMLGGIAGAYYCYP